MSDDLARMSDDTIDPYNRLAGSDQSRNAWVYWTIIGASLLLCLIIFVTLYDIICRFRDRLKSQQMQDGGPPATPSHSFVYTIGIKADVMGPGFDTQMTMIRVELLDSLNRYVTTIAVPCFLLKFRKDKSAQNSQSLSKQSIGSGSKQNTKRNSDISPLHIRSMSLMQEQWSNTVRGELVSFQLARRRPLSNITSARISHDCYVKDSYMVLKYIAIHDHEAKVNFMIDVKTQQIRAIHPCPPSGYQTYPVERVEKDEELRSFIELTRSKYRLFCPSFLKTA